MKRRSVKVKDGKILVNDKPFFMYSGEIHYFRIPKEKWADRLRKAKETGLNMVSSYIPWSWHEPSEKVFDFKGMVAIIKYFNFPAFRIRNCFQLNFRISETYCVIISVSNRCDFFMQWFIKIVDGPLLCRKRILVGKVFSQAVINSYRWII